MRIDAVNGVILYDQVGRCFGSHLRHARNVVCRIALQGLYLNELQRRYAQRLLHVLCVIIQNGCLALLRLRNPDLNVLIRNLQKIPVARNERYLDALRLCLFCQRAEDIVGLQPGLLAGDNAHCLQHLLDQRNLLAQLIRHRMPGSLIVRIGLMAKGRRMHIEGNREVLRLLLLQNLE